MKKLLVHTTATALLLSQLGMANSAFAAENETTPTVDQIQKEEAPALVKGDFFYFVKTTIEKIQLLLTTDKVKEAELLAEFAGERIHEARELIKEGKEDLAKETLKEALTKMEVAQGQVDVNLPTDVNTTTTEDTTSATTEDTTNTTTEGTTTTPVQDIDKDEVKNEENHKLTKEQKEIAKIQHHLNNNLLVLSNVLDQVKNPKAKAAIAKNIEKSFNKISEKLEKLLKKTEHKETIMNPVITIKYPDANEKTDTTTTPEVITTITKIEDVQDMDKNTGNVNEDVKTEADDSDDATEVSTKHVKNVELKKDHHKFEQMHKAAKAEKEAKKASEKAKKAVEHEQKHEERGNGRNHKQHGENVKHEWKNTNHKSNGHESNGHRSDNNDDHEKVNKSDK